MNKIENYSNVIDYVLTEGEKLGNTIEIVNANLQLPTNKLLTDGSRLMSPYYLVGELLYSLRGKNDLESIAYYSKFWNNISDDNKTIRSAYGYLIQNRYNVNQLEHCAHLLMKNPDSRQAIIHLHEPKFNATKDEICTLTIQFLIRDLKLDIIVTMRSNDIVLGLPYDHAFFLMYQSILASRLSIGKGRYFHNVGSLHKYDDKKVNLNINHSKEYPIEFSYGFIDEHKKMLGVEETVRKHYFEVVNNFEGFSYIEHAIDSIMKFEDKLARTFMLAIYLFAIKDVDERHALLRKVKGFIPFSYGLFTLIIDYEIENNKFGGF